MKNVFHMSVGHLYVFFKVCLFSSTAHFLIFCFVLVELYELFMDFLYQSLVGCMVGKYFLLFSRVSLHLGYSILLYRSILVWCCPRCLHSPFVFLLLEMTSYRCFSCSDLLCFLWHILCFQILHLTHLSILSCTSDTMWNSM